MLQKYVTAWIELGKAFQSEEMYTYSYECFLTAAGIYEKMQMYHQVALAYGYYLFSLTMNTLVERLDKGTQICSNQLCSTKCDQ